MASKRSRSSAAAVPPGADDFKLINSINSSVENRLYKAGILTFAQLAALSPGEIVAQVAGLASAERIIKQDWIGQARALAARPAAAPPVELPDHMGAGS